MARIRKTKFSGDGITIKNFTSGVDRNTEYFLLKEELKSETRYIENNKSVFRWYQRFDYYQFILIELEQVKWYKEKWYTV